MRAHGDLLASTDLTVLSWMPSERSSYERVEFPVKKYGLTLFPVKNNVELNTKCGYLMIR